MQVKMSNKNSVLPPPNTVSDYLGIYLLGNLIRYDWHAKGSFKYYYYLKGTRKRRYFTSLKAACEDIVKDIEDRNTNKLLALTYLRHSFSHYALSQHGDREAITLLYKKLIKLCT